MSVTAACFASQSGIGSGLHPQALRSNQGSLSHGDQNSTAVANGAKICLVGLCKTCHVVVMTGISRTEVAIESVDMVLLDDSCPMTFTSVAERGRMLGNIIQPRS